MNKKFLNYIVLGTFGVIIIGIFIFSIFLKDNNNEKFDVKTITATVMSNYNDLVMVQDTNNIIYTFNIKDVSTNNGDVLKIDYVGNLDTIKSMQDVEVVNLESEIKEDDILPGSWKDNGIFSKYYIEAYNKLKTLSLDEKIGQLLLTRYPSNKTIEEISSYNLSGFVFYEKDFKDKYEEDVINMINDLQKRANIPLLTAVDEEGGNVVRVSSNPNLVKEKFKSPSELYDIDGFNSIKEDTINKSNILHNLGLNLNLSPVIDVSTNDEDYIYERTLKKDTELTKEYAKTVIEASKNTGVSYTLKHFPGYGSNNDTHYSESIDNSSYDDILSKNIPPFKAGIEAGAEAVLVSHNIIKNIDDANPASLSPSVHNILSKELKFTGITITDDLSMGALDDIDNKYVKALLAGNDLLIVTDYEDATNSIKNALKSGEINESVINKAAFKVLAWKYYKGLIIENEK